MRIWAIRSLSESTVPRQPCTQPTGQSTRQRPAVAEAQTHAMPIIAVGECPPTTGISAGDELMRRTATLQTLHPDVEITAVPITTGIPQFVESHPAPIQLVVLGAANAGALSTLIGAHDRHDHHEFSVVVVHP